MFQIQNEHKCDKQQYVNSLGMCTVKKLAGACLCVDSCEGSFQ